MIEGPEFLSGQTLVWCLRPHRQAALAGGLVHDNGRICLHLPRLRVWGITSPLKPEEPKWKKSGLGGYTTPVASGSPST